MENKNLKTNDSKTVESKVDNEKRYVTQAQLEK